MKTALVSWMHVKNLYAKAKKRKSISYVTIPICLRWVEANQRGNAGSSWSLILATVSDLKYPLHHIRRGGGVTFHYPGQWIIYPITQLTPKNSLDKVMCGLLKCVGNVFAEKFLVKDVLSAKKLMGVWVNKRKIASIGLGVDRMITEHGLALNLHSDENMFQEIRKISPCGMSSDTYISLEELNGEKDNIRKFHQYFLDSFNF